MVLHLGEVFALWGTLVILSLDPHHFVHSFSELSKCQILRFHVPKRQGSPGCQRDPKMHCQVCDTDDVPPQPGSPGL